MHARTHLTAAILISAGVIAGCAVAQDQPSPPPAPSQPAGPSPETEALLSAIETAGQDMVTLRARLKYDKYSELQGDHQIRLGDLYYVSGKPREAEAQPAEGEGKPRRSGRKFAIHFNEQWLDGVRRDEDLTYIFDGTWLVEKMPNERPPLFLKRQVVAPGEDFDPLRIGEGPFPVPIGQRKADILERYQAEVLPAAAGLEPGKDASERDKQEAQDLLDAVKGSEQLRLTPLPKFADNDDFKEIRLWYRRGADGVLLPRMARTVSKGGDLTTVLLINTAVQLVGEPENAAAAVPASILNVENPGEGWEVRVEPWRGQAVGHQRREGPNVGDEP